MSTRLCAPARDTPRPRALLLLVTGLALVLSGASPASAVVAKADPGDAHITGTVTDVGGPPLPGIRVTAYASNGGDWVSVSTADTGADGSYDLADLDADDYRVRFEDPAGGYVSEYYDNKPVAERANPVSVAQSETTPWINAALAASSHIAGTVTNEAMAGIPGVEAVAYLLDDVGQWHRTQSGITDADGDFDVTGLASGTYRLFFDPPDGGYAPEYWDDAVSLGAADDIVVAAAATTVAGRDATLVEGSHITGTVTNADGASVEQVDVTAYQLLDNRWEPVAVGQTDVAGQYDVAGLAAGTYRIGFDDPSGSYLGEHWDDAPTLEAADDIVVGATTTVTGKDAALATASHITGTVTNAGGDPIEDIVVTAFGQVDGDWDPLQVAHTDAAGSYDLDGLAPGSYRLRFADDTDAYVDEFWDDARNLNSATDVVVGGAEVVTGKDAVLTVAAHIAGTVTDPDGDPLEDVEVTAYQLGVEGWEAVGFRDTDAAGHYDISGLAAGTYRIGFEDYSDDYLAEFWDDAVDAESADDIVIDTGGTAMTDAALTPASHITGTVTTSGGAPLEDVDVTAHQLVEGEWDWAGEAVTDEAGQYDVGDLPAGTYRIGFSDEEGNHLTEFWDDAASLEEADDIDVGTASTVPETNAALTPASHVTGRVTNAAGAGLAGIEVSAHRIVDGDWESVSYALTEADGSYDVGQLVPDTYRIGFHDYAGNHLDEYWDNAPSLASAHDVVVGPSATVPTKDAVLSAASHIRGTVTSAGGQPLDDVDVTAYQLIDGNWHTLDTATTDADGDYSIDGLAAGTYRLGFRDRAGVYSPEFWDDALTLESADDVVVGTSAVVLGKDAALTAASHIIGTVTNTAGQPLNRVDLIAYQLIDGAWDAVSYGNTSNDGTFDVAGLAPGSYRLAIEDYSGNYLHEYWDDAATLAAADDIVVGASETVPGKDAVLADASHITGTVTDRDGRRLEDVEVTAYQLDGGAWEAVHDATTGSNGRYDVGNLPAGSYRIGFDSNGDHAPEFWDNVVDVASANDIVVGTATTVSGRNAVLADGSHISGRVTNQAGSGVEVGVTAYQRVDGDWTSAGYAFSEEDGFYDLDGLAAGTYRLHFKPFFGRDYAEEWWDDAASLSAATNIVVGAEATVPGRNAVLANAAHISGRVTNRAGAGVSVEVTAYRLVDGDWVPTGAGSTDSGGHYDLGGLRAGTYRLGFADPMGDYVEEYWNNAATLASAHDIVVGAGATAPGRDAVLRGVGEPPEITNSSRPTITGTPLVGATLTASPGTWAPTDATYAYQWLAGDDVIEGATSSTYSPIAADAGKAIRVRVTATKAGYLSATETSDPTAAVGFVAIANQTLPSITGTPQVGGVLTADPGTWTPTGTTYAYEWLANDVVIDGATGSTYSPVAADVGKTIKVRVTASKPDHLSGTATSAATTAVAPGTFTVTKPPSFPAKPKVGKKATANPGQVDPVPTQVTYQWLRNGKAIRNATKSSYKPTQSDWGRKLSLRVTFNAPGYTQLARVTAQKIVK